MENAKVDDLSCYMIMPGESFRVELTIVEHGDRNFVFYKKDAPKTKGKKNKDIWIEFYYWTFEQENFWRASCYKTDRITRSCLFDEPAFDRLKVKHLLKDWWLKEYGDDTRAYRVECQCDHCKMMRQRNVNGVMNCLTEDVLKIFYGLKPNLARMIVRAMNEVLES